jgi:Ca2+-binding RTX toxin-like protein
MLTEKFAKSGNDVFVTGVVYDDTSGNDFYTIGEGRGGAVFRIGAQTDTTEAAGGYALKIAPTSSALVEIAHGGFAGSLRLDVSGGNGKLDYEVGGAVSVSVSATIVSGIGHLKLLGVDALNLTGDGAANRLDGNKGNNVLAGGGGDDTLSGGAGADTMNGGDGSDTYFADAFDFVEDTGAGGFDLVVYSGAAAVVMNLGLRGIEHVVGADGNDILDGSAMMDEAQIMGGGGADEVTGGASGDVLAGDSVSDAVLAALLARIDAYDFGGGLELA